MSHMRKTLLMITLIAVILFTAACNMMENTDGKITEIGDLTEKEADILCENYPEDEELIRQGKLHDEQIVALNELRESVSLVESRYPNLNYEITGFVPANKMGPQSTMDLTVSGDAAGIYTVYASYDENSNLRFSENVYGAVYHGEYDEYITAKLKAAGLNVKTYTAFGTEIEGELSSVEDIISGKEDIVIYTDVFTEKVDEEAKRPLCDKVDSIMANETNSPLVTVYFVDKLDTDVSKLEEDRSNLEQGCF